MVQRGEAPCRLTLQGYQLSAAVVSRSVVRLFCGAASAPSPGTVHVVHVVLVGRQPGLVRFDGIWLFTGRSVSVSTTVSSDRFSPTRWGPPSIRRRFSLSLSLRRPTGKYVKASDDMPSSELPGFDWDSPPPSRASVAASTRPADRSAPYSTGPYRRRRRQIEALPSHFRPASARRFSGALGRLRDRRRFAFPQRRNR